MRPFLSLFRGLWAAFSDSRVQSLLLFTTFIIISASVFYHYVEGWSPLNALYFSVITISTIGYGNFSPQTVPGKIFTIGYILVGLGVFVAAASSVAEALIAQRSKDKGEE